MMQRICTRCWPVRNVWFDLAGHALCSVCPPRVVPAAPLLYGPFIAPCRIVVGRECVHALRVLHCAINCGLCCVTCDQEVTELTDTQQTTPASFPCRRAHTTAHRTDRLSSAAQACHREQGAPQALTTEMACLACSSGSSPPGALLPLPAAISRITSPITSPSGRWWPQRPHARG
jgi:hypothetical protein